MRTFTLLTAALLSGSAVAFQSSPASSVRTNNVAVYGYIPDGFTKESYAKFKADEKKKQQTKNLGGVGPRGFKSRSMQSFQEALERGEAEHLLPVFNANERIKKGELKKEDIPYMQRGGSWDNSDIKGAKKKRWSASDQEYAGGGFRKEQSVSIFGYGEGLDWTGSRGRKGPSESIPGAAPKFGRNYKAPNVYQMKGGNTGTKQSSPFNFFGKKEVPAVEEEPEPPKKLFGLF